MGCATHPKGPGKSRRARLCLDRLKWICERTSAANDVGAERAFHADIMKVMLLELLSA